MRPLQRTREVNSSNMDTFYKNNRIQKPWFPLLHRKPFFDSSWPLKQVEGDQIIKKGKIINFVPVIRSFKMRTKTGEESWVPMARVRSCEIEETRDLMEVEECRKELVACPHCRHSLPGFIRVSGWPQMFFLKLKCIFIIYCNNCLVQLEVSIATKEGEVSVPLVVLLWSLIHYAINYCYFFYESYFWFN